MFYEIVAVARDWSILILALPTLAILGGMAFVMWKLTGAVLGFVPKVRPALRTAAGTAQRVLGKVEEVAVGVRKPVLEARAVPVKASTTWQSWRRPDSGKV